MRDGGYIPLVLFKINLKINKKYKLFIKKLIVFIGKKKNGK